MNGGKKFGGGGIVVVLTRSCVVVLVGEQGMVAGLEKKAHFLIFPSPIRFIPLSLLLNSICLGTNAI